MLQNGLQKNYGSELFEKYSLFVKNIKIYKTMTKQDIKDTVIEMFRSGEINYWLSTDRYYDEGYNIKLTLNIGQEEISKIEDFISFPSQNNY